MPKATGSPPASGRPASPRPASPNPASRQSASRQRLIDAALSVFVERGMIAASIEEVCARSGVSVGSLYHHFGGKQGLAGAVYVSALADFQRAFLAALDGHPDAEDGVRAGVRAYIEWCLRSRREMARFVLFEGTAARGAAGDRLRSANRRFFSHVRGWWRPHVERGSLRDLDLDLAHALWLGATQDYCRLQLSARTRVSPKRAEPLLAEAAWLALRDQGG